MLKFVILSILVAFVLGQHNHHHNNNYHQNPQTAAIISEQRYLSGDGKFGAAYEQEDGINFKEETDSDGTRHGSYSYVDPTGERRTISYTAGKNGFQASGDHLPVAPPAPPQPIPQAGYEPNPRYQPQSAPAAPQSQFHSGSTNYDDEGQYDPRHNDPNFSGNQKTYQAPVHQQPQQPQYHAPQQPQPAYHQPQQPSPSYNHNYQQAQPQQHQQQQQQQHYQPPPQQYTTQNPHRFQPPGKLSLNRTPDGFSYSFNKV